MWFELIKKVVAEELLRSIADFKLVRSGEFRLAWYGKIDAATTESEIQKFKCSNSCPIKQTLPRYIYLAYRTRSVCYNLISF